MDSKRYMEPPFVRAALEIVLGSSLVLAAGVLIGGGVHRGPRPNASSCRLLGVPRPP
jgi:hypothetical protein